MRSGAGYRLGMSVVVLASLVAVALTLFPVGTRRAADHVADLAARAARDDGPADLRIDSDEIVVDGRVRWAITVTNDGPGDETGPIVVRGTLPVEAEYVSSSGAPWACTYAEEQNVLTCELPTSLAQGERSQLIVLADSDGSSDLGYTATVIGSGEDPDLANNVEADVWSHTLGAVASGDEAEPAASDATRASGPSGAGEAGAEGSTDEKDDHLPVTGPRFTVALLAVGVALCLGGYRLIGATSLPSLLEEFRQGPLWPRTDMGDHLRRGQ